jgi:micrococcal nuclease
MKKRILLVLFCLLWLPACIVEGPSTRTPLPPIGSPLSATLPRREATPTGIPPTQPAAFDCIPANTLVQQAEVVDVIDGDTIEVRLEDGSTRRVRYIGMDTPERGDPFYTEATDANGVMVGGRDVTLVKDVSETDRYDRLLRYVFVDGTFVNYELVRLGLAVSLTVPPDVSCADTYLEAERLAREDGVGLWANP